MALGKNFKIPEADIKPILKNWFGPNGCFATDRIMVDGCKVGYMYRDTPVNSFDSGWRFFEGSESSGYINNPENAGAYTLNVLCNYDADIIPFLNEPEGVAYKRNKMGFFEKDED